jgi:hypothetical protein
MPEEVLAESVVNEKSSKKARERKNKLTLPAAVKKRQHYHHDSIVMQKGLGI